MRPGWSTPPLTCGVRAALRPSDDSRNNWWVALLTGGEGWHNNHHAHPVSARHGSTWYEFDINYYGIWVIAKLGLANKSRSQSSTRRTRSPPAFCNHSAYKT